ncbi:MAG TPA: preprotein translocase subunit SecE [Allocoleopsis sp.]
MAEKDEAKVKDTKATDAKEAKASSETKSAEESSGFNVSEFLKGTKEELDKVVWPSRQQLVSESLAVILMVTLSATIIYLVDNLFTWAAKQVF